MGQWVEDKEDKPFTPLDRLVHLADYIASRSFIDIPCISEEYKKDIEILIGYEVEYTPTYFQDVLKYLKQYPFDYIIWDSRKHILYGFPFSYFPSPNNLFVVSDAIILMFVLLVGEVIINASPRALFTI